MYEWLPSSAGFLLLALERSIPAGHSIFSRLILISSEPVSMGHDGLQGGFCRDSLSYYPIDHIIHGLPHDIGILMVVTGLVNIIMSLITVGWIKKNEYEAQGEDGQEEAAKSVIFPVFVRMLWFTIASNLLAGVITLLVPFDPSDANSALSSVLYALVVAARHAINEGIAFLLMQKGCGFHAATTAGSFAMLWGAVTFGLMYYIFQDLGLLTDALEISWNLVILMFYLTLILAPEDKLFRRPAVKKYAMFWAIYAGCCIVINLFFLFPATSSLGNCAYVFTNVILIAIFSPLIIYWALLQDSRWWQGLEFNKPMGATEDDMRVPLMGTDLSLFSAQSLAATMDVMKTNRVKMLNFACLKIDFRRPLGGGSFSKVYSGTYRGREVAIKLIYTVDLTADVIQRVAAEASILSSIQHVNIVQIYGVSVLPPSVCLILELCQFGSLSDIIRGYGFDWNISHRYPLTISRADVLHLALGCARGLAAIHALNASICHRDIKSFNFLVDRNFNVKIADLELGMPSRSASSDETASSSAGDSHAVNRYDPSYVVVEERLANWLAPEVITDKRFQQASDVWALGTVLWEIVARKLPFEHDPQAVIREKLLAGHQHPFSEEDEGTPLAELIRSCWSLLPQDRPKASEVAAAIDGMLTDLYSACVQQVTHSPNVQAIREFYEIRYHRSVMSDDRGSSVFRMSYRMSWFDRFKSRFSAPDEEEGLRDAHAFLASSTYALPKVSARDLFANPLNGPRVALKAAVPAAVQEAIGQIKTERYWRSLEASGDAWAAVSVEHPHIILHATSRWFSMFNACSAFGADHHLWSLQALINPQYRAPEAHCSASNSYAMSCTQGNDYSLLQMNLANDFLGALRGYGQVHGMLAFHVIDTNPRSVPSSSSSRVFSLRSSFSENTSARSGHNMMCTIHAYPVHPLIDPNTTSTATTASNSPHNSVEEEPVEEPKTPTGGSRISRSSLFSRPRKFTQSVDAPRPLYYLMLFNELLEVNAAEQQSVRGMSTSFSTNHPYDEDSEDEDEEEEDEEEGFFSNLGRFLTQTKQQRADSKVRYHSLG